MIFSEKMKHLYLIISVFITFVGCEATFELGLKDMQKICSFSFSNVNVTKECVAQLNEVCRSGIVLQMFDASSKFPYPGLAVSTRGDFGNFDQCIDINHKYKEGTIMGKYCYPGLVLPDFSNLSDTDTNNFFKLSICLPDACSAADYNSIFEDIFLKHFPGMFIDEYCVTKDKDKDFKAIDIATLFLLCTVATLIICSTTYDVYLHISEGKSWHPLLIAFSVYTNGLKVLQTSEGNKEQIQIFHGMKSMSMFWVIAGHGFLAWKSMLLTNYDESIRMQQYLSFFYANAGHLAVDTFFYMSGFLLAYQYMKIKSKPLKEHLLTVPQMIIHRYLRLTPAVAMFYLFNISILPRLANGPLWKPAMKQVVDPCYNNPAWTFFLYIQNYYAYPDDLCIVHTWYLSADMQMFILSPLVIIPVAIMLQDSRKLSKCMLYLLGLNFLLTIIPLVTKLVFREYTNIYDTHSSLVDYFVGLMMGVFMREQQNKPFLFNKVKHKSIANLLIWTVIIPCMLSVPMCYQEVETSERYENKAEFYSLMRPAWCIGLSWIVYSCYHGYGGFVNWFLTRPIFQILGKLSYCMYLVHGAVVVLSVVTVRTRVYFTHLNAFHLWCSHVIISVGLAFVWTLAFESPLMIVEKFIMGHGTKKDKSSHT